MKLCRFDGGYGLVVDEAAIEVGDLVAPSSGGAGDPLIAALPRIAGLGAAEQAARPRRPLADLTLLSPIRAPSRILAAPNNYRDHLEEMRNDAVAHNRFGGVYEAGLFLKATTSLVGPGEGIAQRFLDRRTDPEIELVVVIGKPGSDIPAAAALDHVAGYALGLDVTLRGPEERSLRKSIDSYTVLGPWLVTADELPDIAARRISLAVNGTTRQDAALSDMVCDVPHIVEYASRFYRLNPGDLIYTGTPAGVGPIRPGDELLARADGLGEMRVRVRAAGVP